MRPYGRRSVLVSGWRRRAGYDAALILSDRHQPKEIPVEPSEVPKWRPVTRISETVVRRRSVSALYRIS